MLTIYAPFNNKNSKAYEVFDGVQKSWPEQTKMLNNQIEIEPVANSIVWGFAFFHICLSFASRSL